MNFYNNTHPYYCGIDLHARTLYVCIIDQDGNVCVHKEIAANPEKLLNILEPFIGNIVVGVECMHCWYWVADYCEEIGVDFILGHALYMKAIHGGKAKNDRIDSFKIAKLMRGGNFPLAYTYPKEMRATRDLLRRRTKIVRHGANLKAHVSNTTSQYKFIGQQAKQHNPIHLQLLKTVHGIGAILSLTILYEIGNIDRFDSVQNFASYSRLVKCKAESAGKSYGTQGNKIGNAHLKWAFSEAAVLHLRGNDKAKKYLANLQKRMSKAKALSVMAHKLGRCVYFMLINETVFDENRFLKS